MSLQQLRE